MSRLLLLLVITSASAKNDDSSDKNEKEFSSRKVKTLDQGQRKQKSFGFFPYFANMNYPTLPNYNFPDMGYYFPQGKNPVSQEWRTEPFKRKPTTQLMDSPIYYVRLPPSPYVFVPGMGFVSRPPSLNEPGLLDPATERPTNNELTQEDFIHVPIDFVANGKPTNVYQLSNDPIKPKPPPVFNLNKGPYLFNGKPIELYVLQNSYNQMYHDALTNFYP